MNIKREIGVKSNEVGEFQLPSASNYFPYVETYYGNVNHKHNPWWKLICNLFLWP